MKTRKILILFLTGLAALPWAVWADPIDVEDFFGEKPFAPHWTGQLGYTYSTQPTQQGQGQTTNEITGTGTFNFDETGNYCSLGLTGGQQQVEGATSNYGQLNLEGGLVTGSFEPSLQVQWQEGESALVSYTGILNLNFQVWDPLKLGATASAGLQSHQGPVSQVAGTSDRIDEIDSWNWYPGAVVTFDPWEFLSLSLTGELEFSDTYQVQDVDHLKAISLNQTDQIPSLTLAADLTFLKNLELDLSFQVGQENYPAGTVYSPILGRTVNFSTPTTNNFTGYSAGLTYNF